MPINHLIILKTRKFLRMIENEHYETSFEQKKNMISFCFESFDLRVKFFQRWKEGGVVWNVREASTKMARKHAHWLELFAQQNMKCLLNFLICLFKIAKIFFLCVSRNNSNKSRLGLLFSVIMRDKLTDRFQLVKSYLFLVLTY